MQRRPLVVEDVAELADAAGVAEVLRRPAVPVHDGVEAGAAEHGAHRHAGHGQRRHAEGDDLPPPSPRLEPDPHRERGHDRDDERRVGEHGEAAAETGGDEPAGRRALCERAEAEQTAGGEQAAAERVVAQAVDVEGDEGDGRDRRQQRRRAAPQHAAQRHEDRRGDEQ